jgi:hypothetical protein
MVFFTQDGGFNIGLIDPDIFIRCGFPTQEARNLIAMRR